MKAFFKLPKHQWETSATYWMTKSHSEEDAKKIADGRRNVTVWENDKYQVHVRPQGAITHLSIRRMDREPIHDWRDLQTIKNMLVGESHEAVEIYPAEDRLVDTSNQYHLWVFSDPSFRLPFGFGERLVMDPNQAAATGAKQRERV
jgi:hypothetical protein